MPGRRSRVEGRFWRRAPDVGGVMASKEPLTGNAGTGRAPRPSRAGRPWRRPTRRKSRTRRGPTGGMTPATRPSACKRVHPRPATASTHVSAPCLDDLELSGVSTGSCEGHCHTDDRKLPDDGPKRSAAAPEDCLALTASSAKERPSARCLGFARPSARPLGSLSLLLSRTPGQKARREWAVHGVLVTTIIGELSDGAIALIDLRAGSSVAATVNSALS